MQNIDNLIVPNNKREAQLLKYRKRTPRVQQAISVTSYLLLFAVSLAISLWLFPEINYRLYLSFSIAIFVTAVVPVLQLFEPFNWIAYRNRLPKLNAPFVIAEEKNNVQLSALAQTLIHNANKNNFIGAYIDEYIKKHGAGMAIANESPLAETIELQTFCTINSIALLVNIDDQYNISFRLTNASNGFKIPVSNAKSVIVDFDEEAQTFNDAQKALFVIYAAIIKNGEKISTDQQKAIRAVQNLFMVTDAELAKVQSSIALSMLHNLIRKDGLTTLFSVVLDNIIKIFSPSATFQNHGLYRMAEAMFGALMDAEQHVSKEMRDAYIAFVTKLGFYGLDSPQVKAVKAKFEFDQLLENGLPIVSTKYNLRDGEQAHWSANGLLLQEKRKRTVARNYVGTRIKIGDLPIYLGRSIPSESEKSVIESLGEVEIILTNQRLLVAGRSKVVTYYLEKILALDPYRNGVQVIYDGQHHGLFLRLRDKDAIQLELMFLALTRGITHTHSEISESDDVDPEYETRIEPQAITRPSISNHSAEKRKHSTKEVVLTILESVGIDYLQWCVDDLELDVNRNNTSQMIETLQNSPHATPEYLLSDVKVDTLREICRRLNIPTIGNKKELREAIIEYAGA